MSTAWMRSAASPPSRDIWYGAAGADVAPTRGRFISIEGGEGAGKSTQIGLLVAALDRAGIPVRATREPGGSPGGRGDTAAAARRRRRALGCGQRSLVARRRSTRSCRSASSPHACAGRVGRVDRFANSTMAYQGYGKGWRSRTCRTSSLRSQRFRAGPDLDPRSPGRNRARPRRRPLGRRPVRTPRPRVPRKAAPRVTAKSPPKTLPAACLIDASGDPKPCTGLVVAASKGGWDLGCPAPRPSPRSRGEGGTRVSGRVRGTGEREQAVLTPRENPDLLGHENAERELRRLIEAGGCRTRSC